MFAAIWSTAAAKIVADIFASAIASDSIGLSSSEHCGIWQYSYDANSEAEYRADLHNYQKENRAGIYAQNCYSGPETIGGTDCKLFYDQSIPYNRTTEDRCPANSPELCLGGTFSAVTFDTGYLDSSVIGVHSGARHLFRRKTTCSPLNTSWPYIQASETEDTDEITYRYYYGNFSSSNYTYDSSGQPFDWHVPVYSVM